MGCDDEMHEDPMALGEGSETVCEKGHRTEGVTLLLRHCTYHPAGSQVGCPLNDKSRSPVLWKKALQDAHGEWDQFPPDVCRWPVCHQSQLEVFEHAVSGAD